MYSYIGRSVEVLLRKVEALHLMDSKGPQGQVVVPAGWTPGGEVVINTKEGIKEYFANANKPAQSVICKPATVDVKKEPAAVSNN